MPQLARNQNLIQTDYSRQEYYFQTFESLEDLKQKGFQAVWNVTFVEVTVYA